MPSPSTGFYFANIWENVVIKNFPELVYFFPEYKTHNHGS